MKRILFGFVLLLATAFVPAKAQTLVDTVTAGTPKSAIVDAVRLTSIYWLNSSTTNVATIKLYDSSTASTNIARSAYTSYAPAFGSVTNISTNAFGILITNITSVLLSTPTNNSAVTNERPRVLTFTVPANGTRTLTLPNVSVARGLLILSDQAGTYNIDYTPQ